MDLTTIRGWTAHPGRLEKAFGLIHLTPKGAENQDTRQEQAGVTFRQKECETRDTLNAGGENEAENTSKRKQSDAESLSN